MPKAVAERLSLVHRASGLLLGLFLAFHAWQLVSAPCGRFAFVDRLDATALPLAVSLALLFPAWLLHAGLGLRAAGAVRRKEAGDFETPAVRGVQLAAGLLVLVFVVAHLVHVWRPRLGGGTALDLYEILRDDLSKPAVALSYLGGVTVACLHLGQGVTATLRRGGWLRGARAAAVERSIGVLVGSVLFVAFVNVLAHFVAGQGLFGAPRGVVVGTEGP